MTGGGAHPAGSSAPDAHVEGRSRTDFESFSHDQLQAMLRHADPEAIGSVGDHLALAVEKIARIGAELHRHVDRIDWEGASGAAFREWGRGVATSTLKLGDYARSTATALTHAADTLREVTRDMPPLPTAAQSTWAALLADPAARHDPDALARIGRAHAEAEAARLGAADQMRKLAQSYSLATTVIGNAVPPEYPPVPSLFVPPPQARRAGAGSGASPILPPSARDRTARPAAHGSLGRAAGGDFVRDTVSPHAPPPAASGSAETPLTRTQSTAATAPAVPVPTASGPWPNGDGHGTGLLAPRSQVVAPPFTGGSLPYGRSPEAGTAAQLPRDSPRQMVPKASGEPVSQAFAARGSQDHGIVGGSPAGQPLAASGAAQGPAGGVIGGQGPAVPPPLGGAVGGRTASRGAGATGRSGARRLPGEPGGVVGPVPPADFAPHPPGATRDEPRAARRPDGRPVEEDRGASRDGIVPPVIR
ncbi:hypothetical protein [Streptomyces sp. NPDC020983]|uniref:hypothetical protein n=1 Tax=Streptomyces sp. NPDC020983 TaxID=3365106 RepID=UPI00379E9C65